MPYKKWEQQSVPAPIVSFEIESTFRRKKRNAQAPASRSALAQLVQQREELGERDRRTLRTMNLCLPCSPQRGDREGHGNPVIAPRVDLRPMQRLPPGTNSPSSNSVSSAPIAFKFLATNAIRSDSFTRNSFASRIVIPSRVYGAIAASTGSSSIICADSAPRSQSPSVHPEQRSPGSSQSVRRGALLH